MRIIVLHLILAACLVAQSTERSTAASLIIRVSETHTTLGSVVGSGRSCLIVMPNGHVQFQLRIKGPFDENGVVTTYESTLPSREFEKLRTIVDDGEVKALPPFGGPIVASKDVDEWQVFDAEIVRGKRVQRVGYVTWQTEPDNSAWNRAKITLRRLVDWSDAIQSGRSTDWTRVTSSNSLCSQ